MGKALVEGTLVDIRRVSRKAHDSLSKACFVIHTDVWSKLMEKLAPKTQ